MTKIVNFFIIFKSSCQIIHYGWRLMCVYTWDIKNNGKFHAEPVWEFFTFNFFLHTVLVIRRNANHKLVKISNLHNYFNINPWVFLQPFLFSDYSFLSKLLKLSLFSSIDQNSSSLNKLWITYNNLLPYLQMGTTGISKFSGRRYVFKPN